MKKVLEFVGALLVINGAAGLVHEFTGWFGTWAIVAHFPALDGYEIFANIVLIVIGITTVAVVNRQRSHRIGA